MIFKGKKKENIFETYIIDNQQKLYKLAYIYVKNSHDAMDILQESILKAYSNISKLKDDTLINPWMKRIVINTALDFIRKNSKESVVENKELDKGKENDGNNHLIYEVETLEPNLKTIIVLKYFHGYTINEIGDILELPTSTIKNRLHKALKLLRVMVKEE